MSFLNSISMLYKHIRITAAYAYTNHSNIRESRILVVQATKIEQILRLAVVIPLYGAHPHFGLVEHASTEVNENAQPVFHLEYIAMH